MTAFISAAREVKDAGRFDFLDRSITMQELFKAMRI
jgi:hypothetical protein